MAWPALPLSGQIWDADEISDLITSIRPRKVRRGSDFPLTVSSTALQNIGLGLPVEASASYFGLLIAAAADSAGNAADVDYAFSFPAGSTMDFFSLGPALAITASSGDGEWVARVQAVSGTTRGSFGAIGSGVYTNAVIPFDINVGGTPGNLQAMASQNASSANTITIRLGSMMILWRTD